MSRRPGNWAQPDSVDRIFAFTVAPQRGQLSCAASNVAPHHSQVASLPVGWAGAAGEAGRGAGDGTCGCEGGGPAADLIRVPQAPQNAAVASNAPPPLVQNIVLVLAVVLHRH